MHYRELTAWQKAMEAAREVYRRRLCLDNNVHRCAHRGEALAVLAPLLPREETYGMRSQLTRAAASVPANIAEGWTREYPREKAQFLSIAQGSLAEADTFITLCEQIGWFPETETERLRGLLAEVGKMLTVMRRNLRQEIGPSSGGLPNS